MGPVFMDIISMSVVQDLLELPCLGVIFLLSEETIASYESQKAPPEKYSLTFSDLDATCGRDGGGLHFAVYS